MRYGEMAAFEERPHTPYYGAVDATPLYVILLDEYERWTGDRALVRELELEARAAINWIDQYADLHGQRLHLVQAAEREDRPREPELEGLLELDLVRGRPAAELPAGDLRAPGLRLRRQAPGRPTGPARLEGRALRASGSRPRRPISSAASTATSGWPTGATTRSRSTPTERRSTRSPRTTASCSGAASSTPTRPSPSSATSWARGCGRAGASARSPRARAATTRSATTSARSGRSTTRSSPGACAATGTRRRRRAIAAGILDAAEVFEGRLPEAFGGYDRDVTKYPVKYPTACSPQAWSTGAPLLLLRTMLGLEPIGDHLIVDPALPSSIGHLELLDIPGRWGRIDAFGRGRVEVRPRALRERQRAEVGRQARPQERHGHDPTGAPTRVVVVGGGFAGVACARALAKHDDVDVTLDRPATTTTSSSRCSTRWRRRCWRPATSPIRFARSPRSTATSTPSVGEVTAIDPAAQDRDDLTDGQTFDGRLPRPRRGLPAELLQDPRRRARLPALLARRCDALRTRILQAFEEADRDPALHRPGRARLRDRRRRSDRRRGRRRAGRDDQHDDAPSSSTACRPARPRSTSSITAPSSCRCSPTRPTPTPPGSSTDDGVDLRLGDRRDRDRARPRDAVRRLDDQDALRRLGRRPEGRADRGGERGCRRAGAAGSMSGRTCRSRGSRASTSIGDIANIPDEGRGQDPSAARVGRAAERRAAAQEHPRRRSRASRPSRSTTSTRARWR